MKPTTVRLIDHHYNFYNFVIAGFDVWLWVDLCQVTGMSSYQRLHCNNSLLNPTQTEDMTPHHWRILCLPLIKRFHRALRLDLISIIFLIIKFCMSTLTMFSQVNIYIEEEYHWTDIFEDKFELLKELPYGPPSLDPALRYSPIKGRSFNKERIWRQISWEQGHYSIELKSWSS